MSEGVNPLITVSGEQPQSTATEVASSVLKKHLRLARKKFMVKVRGVNRMRLSKSTAQLMNWMTPDRSIALQATWTERSITNVIT